MRSLRLPEFSDWLSDLSAKLRAQVEARLLRIEMHEHFGDARHLGKGLAELKWESGLRVYFARVEDLDGARSY